MMSHSLAGLNEPRTVVQLSLISSIGDSFHRMRWPGRQLSQQAPDWRVINLDARAGERLEWGEQADLLVIFQSNDFDLFPLIERRRQAGRRTLVELNDNFYDAPASAPIAEQWNSPLLWQTYERFLTECDGVIVTGPGLYELFACHTDRPIHILENHFPEPLPEFDAVWTPPGESIGLGWAGSIGHLADLLAFEPVIRDVLDTVPRATLHLMGNAGIPDWLTVPRERLRFTSWGGMSEYLRFWKPVQLGFVPLLETPCNRCRSDIKAVEMAGCGVLPVLPDALPYREFLNATGLPSYDSFETLRRLLLSYLHDPGRLDDDARTCFDYVRTQRVGTERRERLELYHSLMPEQISEFHWPLPAGYHETGGTPQASMSYLPLLDELRTSQQSGATPADLLRRLQAVEAEHRFNPDVALSELNLRRRAGDPGLLERIHWYQQVFPRDLRFRFAELEVTASVVPRLQLWQQTLRHLAQQPAAVQHFFQKDVVTRLSRDLEQAAPGTGLEAAAEQCLNLFPDDAALRFAVAIGQIRAGQSAAAHPHFEWLLKTRQATLRNLEFFERTDVAELATWRHALAARESGIRWRESGNGDSASGASQSGDSAGGALVPTVERESVAEPARPPVRDTRDFEVDSTPMRLAELHYTAGDLPEAERRYAEILARDPGNAVAVLRHGLLLWTSGNEAAGQAAFDRARQLAPQHPLLLDQLSAVYRELGRLQDAIAAAQDAVQFDPSNVAFQLRLSDVLSLAGRHAEAEQACRAALEIEPESKLAQHRQAIELLALGQRDAARRILRMALHRPDVQRWQVIQAVIAELDAKTYLEIGVEQGTNLERIRAPRMLGVDPVSAMPLVRALTRNGVADYFAMTSDSFFAHNESLLEQHPVDVAFIDGLHTFEQSLHDVMNCLDVLRPGGVILMHDCNPTSVVMATPANSMEEVVQRAREGRLPGFTGHWEGWTGDVWKTIATLRGTHDDLRVGVLNCDFGIGVVTRGQPGERIVMTESDVARLEYRDLEADRERLLGLCEPGTVLEFINANRG